MHRRALRTAAWIAWVPGLAALAGSASLPTNQVEHPFGGMYGARLAYSAPSRISQGSLVLGDVSTLSMRVAYNAVFRSTQDYSWYAGINFFGLFSDAPARSPIPESLYGLAFEFGNKWRFHERWALETRLSPGLYTDFHDIDFQDFNLPAFVMVSHVFSPKLTGIFGLNVNARRDIPVIPGIGVSWRFAENWHLLLLFPIPRIQYALSDRFQAHVGVELMRPAFRVGKDYGTRVGRPELDDQIVSYREWRIGGGINYQIMRGLHAMLDAGWMVDRRFHYEDKDLMLNGDGAPYVQLSLGGSY